MPGRFSLHHASSAALTPTLSPQTGRGGAKAGVLPKLPYVAPTRGDATHR